MSDQSAEFLSFLIILLKMIDNADQKLRCALIFYHHGLENLKSNGQNMQRFLTFDSKGSDLILNKKFSYLLICLLF